uniref:GTPase-activating protein gyp7 isoform X3 n=1 Tax=Rhizophora mucronata TaxID=61149 RepID=A0A2P2LBQ7_RHIMU
MPFLLDGREVCLHQMEKSVMVELSF